MANHAAQPITRAGVLANYVAAASGDTCPVGDNIILLVKNAGSSVTVTITSEYGVGGLELANQVTTCGVGETVIGPINAQLFEDPATGLAHLAWSSVTSVSLAVVAL